MIMNYLCITCNLATLITLESEVKIKRVSLRMLTFGATHGDIKLTKASICRIYREIAAERAE